MRQHSTGKSTHICTICLMPFKRATQLRNHLQQQHATTDFDLTGLSNTGTLGCPELTSSSSVNILYYNSSHATAVFSVGQRLQLCDAVDEEAISQCGNVPARFIVDSETTDVAGVDSNNEIVLVSAVSEMCDSGGVVSLADKSSLDYLHSSCSVPESDLLFPQDHADSLPLPLPSLVEDSISDVIDTSNSDSFSAGALSSLNRPDISDVDVYLSWHAQFANAACSASVPLTGDQLQSVLSVYSFLAADMTALMTDTSVVQQQHYSTLLDVVRKLGAVVELHLQILQPAAANLRHE